MQIDYPEYWPFFVRKPDGQMTGFFYEIITTALGRMDVRARWHAYPWGRCQDNVRKGEADAMITVPTAERLLYTVTHKDPFYRKNLNIFTYSNHPRLDDILKIKTIDDIYALDLSVVTYVGNGWNDKHIKNKGIKTYEPPLIANVWGMLARKRGDIAIEWPVAAWPDITRLGLADRVVGTEISLSSMPFHLMVRQGTPFAPLMDRFNEVILDMQQQGVIDKIVTKYLTMKDPRS